MTDRHTEGMTTITFTEKNPRKHTIWADSLCEADWHYVVTTIPGTYEARCTTLNGIPCSLEDAYWVIVSVDAVCTGGYMPREQAGTDSLGKPMPFRLQAYGYDVRDSLKGEDSPYTIQAPVSA